MHIAAPWRRETLQRGAIVWGASCKYSQILQAHCLFWVLVRVSECWINEVIQPYFFSAWLFFFQPLVPWFKKIKTCLTQLKCKFPLNYGSVLELMTNIITRFMAHREVVLSKIQCTLYVTELVADSYMRYWKATDKQVVAKTPHTLPVGSARFQQFILSFLIRISAPKNDPGEGGKEQWAS